MSAKFNKLRTRLGEIIDLGAAISVLGWDQQTYMPSGGAEARAMQLSTLTKTVHDWFVSDEIGQLLDDLEAELSGADHDSFEAGYIGYFPTYSLGNLLAAQFYNQAVTAQPGITAQIEQGEFATLFNWMRENIHKPGRMYTPAGLVERVTGDPIRTAPFLDYIRAKYTDIYNL